MLGCFESEPACAADIRAQRADLPVARRTNQGLSILQCIAEVTGDRCWENFERSVGDACKMCVSIIAAQPFQEFLLFAGVPMRAFRKCSGHDCSQSREGSQFFSFRHFRSLLPAQPWKTMNARRHGTNMSG